MGSFFLTHVSQSWRTDLKQVFLTALFSLRTYVSFEFTQFSEARIRVFDLARLVFLKYMRFK